MKRSASELGLCVLVITPIFFKLLSCSTAVISALKGLQEKIRKLELERADAEDNLKSLAVESRHYKEVLQKEHSAQKASEGVISKQNKGKLVFLVEYTD